MSTQPSPRPTRSSGSFNTALLGLIFILIGVLFVFQQFGKFSFDNWWALFILLPALGSISTAYGMYRRNGRFHDGVRANLFVGLIILTVALLFLFNLSWEVFWPLFVLLPGLMVLSFGLHPGAPRRPLSHRLHEPWSGWIGGSTALLGLTFLLNTLGIFDPAVILARWWSIFILLPAVGGLITSLRLIIERSHPIVVISNTTAALAFGLTGLVALLGLDWNLLAPMILIGAGLTVLLGAFRRK